MPEDNTRNDMPADDNPAGQRHWVYGFNTALLVVVGLVILVLLLAFSDADKVKAVTKFDWSSNGANSLSPGSKKMIAEINKGTEKYTIWSLFTDASDSTKRDDPTAATEQTRMRDQIRDLLNLYKRASDKITVEDRGDAARDDIERQIRDRYKDDFKPYQDVVNAYGPLVKDLSKFLTDEAAAIGANAQKPGTPDDERQAAASIQAQFSEAPSALQQMQKVIQRKTDDILPDWGGLTDQIKTVVDGIESSIATLEDAPALKSRGFPPSIVNYFAANAASYKDMDAKLKAYEEKLTKLQPLKAQDILNSLARNTIVIMSEKSAKVIGASDIYTENPGQNQQGLLFKGEEAISSALYSMAKPDKIKVVFVTPTPQHLLDDSYSDMKSILQDNNFDVLEWSPSAEAPQPGMPPPSSGPPPASGKGVVWVVFTPDQPSMQMMMQGMSGGDPKPVLDATRDHMAKGGQVLFMAEAGGMMGPGTFPYADLIKDFGIDVESKYSVVKMREQQDPDTGQRISRVIPYVGLDDSLDMAKSDITTPMDGLPTVFGPMASNQGSMGAATVVKVLSPLPTGVTAQELIKTPYNPEYWGATDSSPTAKFQKGTDYEAPVPLMAIAIKDKGKKAADGSSDEKRVAVIGAKWLGSNFFLDVTAPEVVGNVRYLVPQFPGNGELMKNTILWLAGYENMIAVTAKADAAQRIGNVTPTELLLVRLGVIVVAPALALVVGALVWSARRR